MIKFYCDKEKVSCEIRNENGQGNCVVTYNSMSRQTAQQAIRIIEEKFVVTKEFLVSTEIAKDLKKSCRDRVDRLKSKCLMRQTPKEQGHEKMVANRFGVAT